MNRIFLYIALLLSNVTMGQEIMVNPYLSRHIKQETLDSMVNLLTNFISKQDSLFIMKDSSLVLNPYWIEEDLTLYRTPFFYFRQASEGKYDDRSVQYHPVILSISREMEYEDYMARIAYVGKWDSVKYYVNQINDVAITKNKNGEYKLKFPVEMLTKYWRERKVGKITYKINHNRTFNEKQAQRMDSCNNALASYFHVNACTFTYYSCKTYQDLWRTLGVEFNQTMYANDNSTGGYSLHYAKRIFAGNNSEYYPHELVHIYANIIYSSDSLRSGTKYNGLIDEGIATYFGGSQEKDLGFHLECLKKYLVEHDCKTLDSVFGFSKTLPGMKFVGEKTDVYYAIGGLVAYLVDKKVGYKGLIDVLTDTYQGGTEEYLAKIYDIPVESVNSFVYDSIFEYLKK